MGSPADQTSRAVLTYEAPLDRPRPPNPVLATLLCLPGAACWVVFISVAIRFRRIGALDGRAAVLLWALAVVTAVFSLVLYARGPKPWYVVVCLIINGGGLLFTLAALVFSFT